MVVQLAQFQTGADAKVIIELAELGYGDVPVSSEPGVIRNARMKLDDALATIKPTVDAIVGAVAGVDVEELQVQFGVMVNSEIGGIIAKAGTSVHFQVALVVRPGRGPRKDG